MCPFAQINAEHDQLPSRLSGGGGYRHGIRAGDDALSYRVWGSLFIVGCFGALVLVHVRPSSTTLSRHM